MLTNNIFNILTLTEDVSIDDMQQRWEPIQRDYPGPLILFAMTAVPENNSILIDGGVVLQGDTYVPPKLTTTLYDLDTEDWATDIYIAGHPAVSLHTATLGPRSTVFVWGGTHRPLNYETEGLSLSYPPEMARFDLISRTWNNVSSPPFLQSNRMRHAASLGKDGTTIYYIGGVIPTGPANVNGTSWNSNPAPMNQIILFNTNNLQWDSRNTTGDTPTTRSGHTLNLNPITGELIMFGGYDPYGTADQWTRSDYCYTLNTDTMAWQAANIAAGDGASHTIQGIYYHSSVVVEKYLFIMFGALPPNESPSNDTRVLDLETMTWATFFEAPKSSGTSTGTIVGAVIGSVAGVAIIGAVIFFILRRRRRRAREEKPESTYSAGNQDRMIPLFDDDRYHTERSYNPRPTSPFNAISTQDGSTADVPYSSDTDRTRYSMSHFYGTEKPDASSPGSVNEPRRIVMTPVKPDGV
ncbi:hypothetical protein BJV82DRAFT_675023 [Fennellomyces sp. T-0311]|nr:hypothetical protein BJV82DRAFT_675023 [Fennellomyces sp. T-0311]